MSNEPITSQSRPDGLPLIQDDMSLAALNTSEPEEKLTDAAAARKARLLEDDLCDILGPYNVRCRGCDSQVRLSKMSLYNTSHWQRHRSRCPSVTSATPKEPPAVQRKNKLLNDPDCVLLDPYRVQCRRCGRQVQLHKHTAYSVGNWVNHNQRCPRRKMVSDTATDLNTPTHAESVTATPDVNSAACSTSSDKPSSLPLHERALSESSLSALSEPDSDSDSTAEIMSSAMPSGAEPTHQAISPAPLPASRHLTKLALSNGEGVLDEAASQRKEKLLNDSLCKVLSAYAVECLQCHRRLKLLRAAPYDPTNWDRHLVQCGMDSKAIQIREAAELARLAKFRDDTRCEVLSPYMVRCFQCNRDVRLKQWQKYEMHNWKAHISRCTGRPRKIANSAKADITARELLLRNDEMCQIISPQVVRCCGCNREIRLCSHSSYSTSHWFQHKERCAKRATTGRVVSASSVSVSAGMVTATPVEDDAERLMPASVPLTPPELFSLSSSTDIRPRSGPEKNTTSTASAPSVHNEMSPPALSSHFTGPAHSLELPLPANPPSPRSEPEEGPRPVLPTRLLTPIAVTPSEVISAGTSLKRSHQDNGDGGAREPPAQRMRTDGPPPDSGSSGRDDAWLDWVSAPYREFVYKLREQIAAGQCEGCWLAL